MSVKIPDRDLQGFETLLKLDEEQIEIIKNAFNSGKITADPAVIAEEFYNTIGLSRGSAINLVRAIVSGRATVFSRSSINLNELIDSILDSLAKKEDFNEEDRDHNRNKIESIISDNFGADTIFAVSNIYNQHENPLGSVRIFTDMRPIFTKEDPMSVSLNLIYHNLQISVKSNSKEDTYYFALSGHDLFELKSVIERAIMKEEILVKLSSEKMRIAKIEE